MGRISISLVLIFVTFFSCKSYYQNQNGGYRPKNPKFELAKTPYQLKRNDLIDTNAVYVNEATIYYGSEAIKKEYFIRFFSNGRCYFGSPGALKTKLTLQKINNINEYGGIGYYKLEGKRLKMEEFRVGGQFGNTPYYNKINAIIKNDTLFIIGEDENQIDFSVIEKENRSFYIRRKVEGLTGTPDW